MLKLSETKIKGNKTEIPSVIMDEFKLKEDTVIKWCKNSEGDLVLKFEEKPKEVSILRKLGHSSNRLNSVNLNEHITMYY